MEGRSFLCNVCANYQTNDEKCSRCNGQGQEWKSTCPEKYNEDPQEYMKNLILACK